MDVVNDGTWDCPDGEDEGEGEGGDDDYEPDCEELSMEMFLEYDAAGDIFFTASSMCYFSQYDSDDMRTMWDQYIGDNDGILNESEANMVLTMMANSSSDDNSSDDDDGNWTIDGALVEMTITETFNGLAETGRISIAFNMVSESIGDDGTGVHTVIYVADTIIDDDNACLKADVISSLDFEPTMVTVTTAFDVIDEGNGSWSIEEIPNSAGECLGEPNTATIVFGAIEDEPTEPVDTEPTCAYSWTIATDTSWESETGVVPGPDGDVNMTFIAGSYMIAVQCSDAEGDDITAEWSTIDGSLSASETGSSTVFGWVQFTIPEGVSGTMNVDYSWSSTTFGDEGTFTFNFEAPDDPTDNSTTDPEDEIVGSGGGIPGFTSVITVTALLGAVLYLGRRD